MKEERSLSKSEQLLIVLLLGLAFVTDKVRKSHFMQQVHRHRFSCGRDTLISLLSRKHTKKQGAEHDVRTT